MCGELKKARKKKKEKRKKGEINYRDKERKKRDIAWPQSCLFKSGFQLAQLALMVSDG